MMYIKTCPECGRNIRFPLDKGKIKITCGCGHNEIIDPDNPKLYKTGKFDVELQPSGAGPLDIFLHKLDRLLSREGKEKIINTIYDFSYSVQNIRLLPNKEKIKIIIKLMVLLSVTIIISYCIAYIIRIVIFPLFQTKTAI